MRFCVRNWDVNKININIKQGWILKYLAYFLLVFLKTKSEKRKKRQNLIDKLTFCLKHDRGIPKMNLVIKMHLHMGIICAKSCMELAFKRVNNFLQIFSEEISLLLRLKRHIAPCCCLMPDKCSIDQPDQRSEKSEPWGDTGVIKGVKMWMKLKELYGKYSCFAKIWEKRC